MSSPGAPRIQFATTSDGVRIAYAVAGEGEPMVCVPGWVSNLEFELQGGNRTIGPWLGRGRRLLFYDGRGTGLSDRNVDDLSVEARLRDLEAVIEHAGLERFSLFAWSQGSPVAITYAAEHAERVENLILFASFCEPFAKNQESRLLRALIDLIRAEWGVGIRATLGFTHPDASKEEEQEGLAYLRQASSGEVAARILEEGAFHADVRDLMPRVTAPTLVLHRRDDKAVPMECGRRVAALLPDARFVVLDGDHHLPSQGDVDAVARAVNDFLGMEHEPIAAAAHAHAHPHAHPEAHIEAPVTLLFTDIEGSTTLTQRLGDQAAQAIVRQHNNVVRQSLQAHGGSEVKHTGDGIMASFVSASRALECAVRIQRMLAEHNQHHPDLPIQVRIGLNAGEPVREGGDLFGTAVQLARRICDQAQPGQILAANVVRELTAGKGFLFSDLGEVVPKGFEDPVRLYQVRWEES
jgi:class 3 adenylate cyclase